MQQIILDIQARLLAQVPALKYVDVDWGQLDYYSPNPPVKWPCALIDLSQATWSNLLKKVQLGLVTIRIRIADQRLSNSSGAAPTGQREKAMAIFTTLENVHQALHGWAGGRSYSKLIRTANTRINREDGVRIYEITFTTELTDASATGEQLTHAATPQVLYRTPAPGEQFITTEDEQIIITEDGQAIITEN